MFELFRRGARPRSGAGFQRFPGTYRPLPEGQQPGAVWTERRLLAAEGYAELAGRFAGCTFENGLYRLHDATTGPLALALVEEAFPEAAGAVVPFGQDWLGRQFALDADRVVAGELQVTLFEPGTGEALDVPASFAEFHEEVLVDRADDALAASYFADWVALQPSALPLPSDRCAGFEIPLFLGGEDVVDNLAVTDLEVYWSLCGQLRLATAGLEEGTPVLGVALDD